MKVSRTFSRAFIFFMLLSSAAFCQIRMHRSSPVSYSVSRDDGGVFKKWSLPGLVSDRQSTVFKPSGPFLSLPLNNSFLQGDSYWMGSVTSQSYNHGKIGRYYYWDIQGNLRDSYLFFDIAGKNKRGLKLVFPRHRTLY